MSSMEYMIAEKTVGKCKSNYTIKISIMKSSSKCPGFRSDSFTIKRKYANHHPYHHPNILILNSLPPQKKHSELWGFSFEVSILRVSDLYGICFKGLLLLYKGKAQQSKVRYVIDTVDGSEIPNNHLGCKKKTVNNWINYQPQLVQDFFHQQ